MQFSNSFEKLIPNITDKNFKSCALDLFNYQAQNNTIYRQYMDRLGVIPNEVNNIKQIPFLPIQFFKTYEIKTGPWTEQNEFLSSGTTDSGRSRHMVKDISFYQHLAGRSFESFYGKLKDFIILALLPSYLEQGNSSLISMVDYLIGCTKNSNSGYVTVNNLEKKMQQACQKNKYVLLMGVTYALMDAVFRDNSKCDNLIVMETGGMKGRKKELTRKELHNILQKKFNQESIHSEYGMTELLSQAYAKGNGFFKCSAWMKIFIRDINDPFDYLKPGHTGGINVIDLANIHSCAFIETKDIGRITKEGSFEVLGRFDNSDLRGCNLLMA